MLNTFTTEQMDIICDFLTHCEAMSNLLLELACAYMRFQNERTPSQLPWGSLRLMEVIA